MRGPSVNWLINLLSGILRILILIGYILFCAKVPDVRRTFEYHGAEHKTVYCNEHGLPLTPENAQQFTTLHPRCGTSFLLIVFVISIVLFTLVGYQGENFFLRLGSRLLLLPFVAGLSYEVLKGLAHSESPLARALRWPGMQMQRLTTRQPTDEMLEVAIVSMNVALHGLPKGCETTPGGIHRHPGLPRARPPTRRRRPRRPPRPSSDAMRIRQALADAACALEAAGVPDPRIDAEWLLSHVTGMDRLVMRLSGETELTPQQEQRLTSLLLSRTRRRPLQYVLGTQGFYGLELRTDARALIPRQETETLCETGILYLRSLPPDPVPSALDLCSGSGAIALALRANVPSRRSPPRT